MSTGRSCAPPTWCYRPRFTTSRALRYWKLSRPAAFPVLPDRLCYPEWCPPENLYASSVDDAGVDARNAAALLANIAARKRAGEASPVPDVEGFSWPSLRADYAHLLQV